MVKNYVIQTIILLLSKAKQFSFLSLLVAVLSFGLAAPAVKAELFDSPLDRLTAIERNTLRQGQPLVTGKQGKFTARVLVDANTTQAWQVLIDYPNLPKFIPNLISCQILETPGPNQKVIEQIDSRQVLFVTVRSRNKIAITETPEQQIDFDLIEGDLRSLKGNWRIEPVSAYRGAPATQVLITQTLEAQPGANVPNDIFYDVFKEALAQNLGAIRSEIKRRASLGN